LHFSYQDEIFLSGQMLLELTNGVLTSGKPFRFRARGSSMFPFIRDGDVISLSPPGKQKPRLGEVVAFIRPGTRSLVVHRVIGCAPDACLIKGDNCTGSPDGWIQTQALVGYVSQVERSGRRRRVGLGFDGAFVALLSRLGLLMPLVTLAASLRRRILKVGI
jgi:hypothetical protein